mmetsp:Transcript_29043/g.76619  ORF Transcript_29043/g.76619 Transcript_29043/m.76619 type:complete len:318 (+) Transcript_29043:405-1358(+)
MLTSKGAPSALGRTRGCNESSSSHAPRPTSLSCLWPGPQPSGETGPQPSGETGTPVRGPSACLPPTPLADKAALRASTRKAAGTPGISAWGLVVLQGDWRSQGAAMGGFGHLAAASAIGVLFWPTSSTCDDAHGGGGRTICGRGTDAHAEGAGGLGQPTALPCALHGAVGISVKSRESQASSLPTRSPPHGKGRTAHAWSGRTCNSTSSTSSPQTHGSRTVACVRSVSSAVRSQVPTTSDGTPAWQKLSHGKREGDTLSTSSRAGASISCIGCGNAEELELEPPRSMGGGTPEDKLSHLASSAELTESGNGAGNWTG